MDKEVFRLIQWLISQSYLRMDEARKHLNMSRRQIIYRLDKLNRELREKGLPPVVLNEGKQFVIPEKTRSYLEHLQLDQITEDPYYLNKHERQMYAFLLMFLGREYLGLQYFIDYIGVSRSTLYFDLKNLATELQNEQVIMSHDRTRGFYLSGNEIDIRRSLMRRVIGSMTPQRDSRVFNQFITDQHLRQFDDFRDVFEGLADSYQIVFVEDRMVEFIYIAIFLIERITKGYGLSSVTTTGMDLSVMNQLREYHFTRDLLGQLEIDATMDESEVAYLSSWILGISVGDIEEDSSDMMVIGQMVGRIIRSFEYLSGVRYRDGEEIFRQLYSHFRPAYYRLLFHLPIYNPLADRVRREYPDLFSLVRETMKPFGALLDVDIPDDELAYLTMHFATIFTRSRETEPVILPRALIVCSNGIGSSAILYGELKSLLPELSFYPPIDYGSYRTFRDPVDIIFTTQMHPDMTDAQLPVIRVMPVMDATQQAQLVRETMNQLNLKPEVQTDVDRIMTIVDTYIPLQEQSSVRLEIQKVLMEGFVHNKDCQSVLGLIDMIDPSMIMLNAPAENWKEAMEMSARLLERQGRVMHQYVRCLMREVEANSPANYVIVKGVAFPHTKPENGALMCGLSIVTLQHPIAFGHLDHDPVSYVFCLSALDNQKHLNALSQFLQLLNDPRFYKALREAQSPDLLYHQIVKLIMDYPEM